jgi:hypothetical protein
MSKIVRFAVLLAAAATLPLAISAQQRGGAIATGSAPAAAPAAPSAGRVAHSPSTGSLSQHSHHVVPVGVHGTGDTHHSTGTTTTATTEPVAAAQTSTPNVVVVPADSGITLQDLTGQVPGLGFDYEHLAAISGNLAEKALIDPVTMEELALAQRFNRGGVGSSAYILGGYGYGGGEVPVDNGDTQDAQAPPADPAPQPAPQIIILQQPAAPGASPAQSNAVAAAPLQEASDFLLVLKTGAMVSAVAFTRQGDQLIYVTKEGNRRTMSVATIDSDATSKINAARGTPLKLSI